MILKYGWGERSWCSLTCWTLGITNKRPRDKFLILSWLREVRLPCKYLHFTCVIFKNYRPHKQRHDHDWLPEPWLCKKKLILSSLDGLSPTRCQAITKINDDLLTIWPSWNTLHWILNETFQRKKMYSKLPSAKCGQFGLSLNTQFCHFIYWSVERSLRCLCSYEQMKTRLLPNSIWCVRLA